MTCFSNLGSTNTLLPPLSPGAKQEVANSVHDHQEEPPKGELKLWHHFKLFYFLV